ncbi:LacI family DNA-binding transcriptional regulator [Bifidobacterium aerophilum]|uniref:Substrate-binding domain-containing protein n=1 Tax=Bifidobacterium aerophilum TaxID=1798155 RepID=A0A6N9Z5X0_9BIFI|nr:LacI family DNA-binding transcriptional regulator [Bifidobacterium aerophilum]NEG90119.1 substrate-binding domain-containing protein [Bifidobacterium aerophilum]
MGKVTLDDIARVANVSRSTVSKALRDTGRLAPDTRRLVRDVARDLGYGLVQGERSRSGIIGLLTSDLRGRFSLPLLDGAEQVLGESQCSVSLIYNRDDARLERRHIDRLAAHGLDGLIVTSTDTDPRPALDRRLTGGLPVVYAYAGCTDPHECSVTCDNERAGYDAVSHLLGLGRRRIAIIGPEDHWDAAAKRMRGALRALDEAGLKPVEPIQYGDWNQPWGYEAAGRLLDRGVRFDGLYCLDDLIARGAIERMQASGARIPDDVAVVGHDDWDVVVNAAHPTITSFSNNTFEIGRVAARCLLDALDGSPRRGEISVRCPLVIRESTVYGGSGETDDGGRA